MMKIYITADYTAMSQMAGHIMAEQLKTHPESVLGLATGSTPEGLYANLANRFEEGQLDFSRCTTFNLDEYVGLDPAHEQSYAFFMHHHLFSKVNVREDFTHLPNGVADDLDRACQTYETLIEQAGGVDVQLLGIGNNGHIGFNEPDDAFAAMTHVVELTKSTIEANARFFRSPADVPTRALTMGIGTIMRAGKILLVASGSGKNDIVKKALFGPVTPRVPASILQFHPDVTVVGDRKALDGVCEMAPQRFDIMMS